MATLFFLLFIAFLAILIGLSKKPKGQPRVQSEEPKPEPSVREPKKTEPAKNPSTVKSRPNHAPPPEIPTSRKLYGKAWVIDGDTIAIKRIKIRLAGIDAPELDQPWGQKSKWEMVKICKGKTIHVELTGETSYDRLVGTCYLPDGTDIGAELIKAGLALDGGHFSKGKYRDLEPEGIRKKLKFYGHWR